MTVQPSAPHHRRLRPYPAYKPSGVEWLGEVPEHWAIMRLKNLCRRSALYGANEPATSYVDGGVRFLRTTDITDHGNLLEEGVYLEREVVRDYILSNGDLLISRSGTIGRAFQYEAERHGPCAYAGYLVRFVPGSSVIPRFLWYFTKSNSFEQWLSLSVIASTIGNVNGQKYANMHLIHPPLDEQRAIADFLDRETGRIDALMEKKQRQIELLQEKRTALISHAVTKGLGPKIKMKDSGVEWLGKIPMHWEVKKVKFLAEILRGKFSHRPRNDPQLYDGPYPFIQTGDIVRANKYINDYQQTLNELGFAVSKEFPRGTLVMSIAANIGDLAILEFPACFPDSIVGFFPKTQVDLNYLYYNLESMKQELKITAPLNTQQNLNIERIGPLKTVSPPINEQRQIAVFLDQETAKMEDLIAKIQESIDKLKEYRTALISAAVTGRIDVREEVSRQGAKFAKK